MKEGVNWLLAILSFISISLGLWLREPKVLGNILLFGGILVGCINAFIWLIIIPMLNEIKTQKKSDEN
tara:strand:- start:413 stop:616 length:204 start_codon:yes stop_codon:yes gene_type:complete